VLPDVFPSSFTPSSQNWNISKPSLFMFSFHIFLLSIFLFFERAEVDFHPLISLKLLPGGTQIHHSSASRILSLYGLCAQSCRNILWNNLAHQIQSWLSITFSAKELTRQTCISFSSDLTACFVIQKNHVNHLELPPSVLHVRTSFGTWAWSVLLIYHDPAVSHPFCLPGADLVCVRASRNLDKGSSWSGFSLCIIYTKWIADLMRLLSFHLKAIYSLTWPSTAPRMYLLQICLYKDYLPTSCGLPTVMISTWSISYSNYTSHILLQILNQFYYCATNDAYAFYHLN
jgi:hypothetical protein